MALFGQIAANNLGDALSIADQVLQNQVSIEDVDGNDIVYLNVTESETLDMSVQITEHPIEDSGSVADYVSRSSIPMTLTGVLSNRNFDLRRDPLGAILSRAAALAPAVVSTINTGISVASNFFDLGADEQTRKLQVLFDWQSSGKLVKVRGVKVDLGKISKIEGDLFWLIEGMQVMSEAGYGDGIGIQLTLKHLFVIEEPFTGGLQGVRGVLERFVSLPRNPFA